MRARIASDSRCGGRRLRRLAMASSAPAMAKLDDARSFRCTNVIRERWPAVELFEFVTVRNNVPVGPAVKVLWHVHRCGGLFMIIQGDGEVSLSHWTAEFSLGHPGRLVWCGAGGVPLPPGHNPGDASLFRIETCAGPWQRHVEPPRFDHSKISRTFPGCPSEHDHQWLAIIVAKAA